MSNHIIVYSHGFGVRKDDRGLFTDIARAIPDAQHVLFDYNNIDEAKNVLTVSSLQEQVRRLKEQLDVVDDGTEKIIDIVAHSQGCLVVAFAKPKNIRQILCLAPPDNIDTDRLVEFFGNREGSTINLSGESRIPRRDGSTTIIPAAYWQSIQSLDVIRLYNRLSGQTNIKFLIPDNDEVLGVTNFDQIDELIDLVQTSGDHDFTGDARQSICQLIAGLLKLE